MFGYSPCVLQMSCGQPFLCCLAPKHTAWWQQQSAWSCLEVPCRLEAWVQMRAIQGLFIGAVIEEDLTDSNTRKMAHIFRTVWELG